MGCMLERQESMIGQESTGADRLANKENSHMVKHRPTSHPELPEPPVFKFKLVSSYRDAITRQISED